MSTPRFRRAAFVLVILLAGVGPAAEASAPVFPVPESIRGNVDFWVRVFSEWTQGHVVVHHMDYPALVFEVIELPGTIGDRYTPAQKEAIAEARDRWASYLRYLEVFGTDESKIDDIDREWMLHLASHAGADALSQAYRRVRTQRGLRERFHRGLERSSKYDERMRTIFRDSGLPEDLVFLPHVESSFHHRARSSAGATGIWQFTRDTGKRYLRIDSAIDERLDPIAATYGAAAYLRDAYESLGSWPLAVTSYNHGVQGMRRAHERFGDDFGRIYSDYDGRSFGFASKNFYAEFLAARLVAGDPEHYFPEGHVPEPALDHDHVVLEQRVSPQHLSRFYGVQLERLSDLNPGWSSRAVRRGLSLPAGTRVWLPRGTVAQTTGSAERTAHTGSYVVKKGDTLSGIATRFELSLKELRQVNDLPASGSLIHPGQELVVLAPPKVHTVRRGETLSSIAAAYGLSLAALRELNDIPARSSLIRVGQQLTLGVGIASLIEHVVRSGETLLRIASRYRVPLSDLLAENTLHTRSIIRPGQVLRIPVR